MQKINIDRAVRCMAIVLSDNSTGSFIAMNLISNMFDYDQVVATQKFLDTKGHLRRHKKAGGGLKDFEDGLFAAPEVE